MPTSTPTPSVDSMADNAGARAERHFDRFFRAALQGDRVTRADGFVRIITGEAHPFGNFAAVTRSDDVGVTVAAAEDLAVLDAPSAVGLAGGPLSTRVRDTLTELGFVDGGDMPAMAADIDALVAPDIPSDCRLERFGEGDDSEAWAAALATGYDLPLGVAAAFSPNAIGADDGSDAPIQFYGLVHEGEVVSTSLLFLGDGLAGIYCVSTVPNARNRGYGAISTAGPLRLARDWGYRVGVLQASPAGHPVYERMGFSKVGTLPMWIRMPDADDANTKGTNDAA